MANNNLTIDTITRESLRVLHQKLNFVTNIVTEYDDTYAQSGAKVGNTARIRLPIQYATGTGPTMATGTGADTLENQVTLTLNTQRHVPMRFTSNEMTMKIDEFSKRHVEPAMSKLAAMIESDVLGYCVPRASNVSYGTKVDQTAIMTGRGKLQDALAPMNDRFAILDTQANIDLVTDNKSLFQAQDEIRKQYKEGHMGRHGGFNFFENTMLPSHTSGAEGGGVVYDVDTLQSGSYTSPNSMNLKVKTGTKTILAGDTLTIAGVYDVHPETKATRAALKTFTIITGGTGTGTLVVSPALIATGPHQNASAAAADGALITVGGAASTAYNSSILFQKGFAAFASADLELPKGTAGAARASFDGISLRMVQDYSIVKDQFLTRLDVLYGKEVLRPQLGHRCLHT